MSQPVFTSGQKNQVRVRLGQKILTRFVMSTCQWALFLAGVGHSSTPKWV